MEYEELKQQLRVKNNKCANTYSKDKNESV